MPSKKSQFLVDAKFWNQVIKQVSPVHAQWILENKGRGEAKFIQANCAVKLDCENIVFGFFAQQMTRPMSFSGMLKTFHTTDRKAILTVVEKAIVITAIRLGHLPPSVQYCGRRLVKEEDGQFASRSSAKGFVYFIRNGDLCKIGITENLLRRFNELQPEEILNVVRCANFQEVEKQLHKHFKDVRVPQTEYFRLSDSQQEQVHRLLTELAEQ
jgi:hypothetical protein